MAGTGRMSIYSTASSAIPGLRHLGANQQSSQVSTTTLLNAVHAIYTSGQPYPLDASTSLVVNTWLTASQPDMDGRLGGTVDAEMANRAWEHARRRAEDACIVLGYVLAGPAIQVEPMANVNSRSLHASTPSMLTPFLDTIPVPLPASLFTALTVLRPLLNATSPQNHATPHYAALAVKLTLTLGGTLSATSLALSDGGLNVKKGLLEIPAEAGYRAFDVFYYLLTTVSTPAEREFLGLKEASSYALLAKSSTYEPPAYLPTADDTAAADDFRASLKALGIKGPLYRNFISVLAGLLKLGNTLSFILDDGELEEACEDVGGLLGIEPEMLCQKCNTTERETLIAGLYEALVDWILTKVNEAMAMEVQQMRGDADSLHGSQAASNIDDTVCITILDVPDPALGKALAMRGVFDDTQGINQEMKEDGVEVVAAGSSIIREVQNAIAEQGPHLGIMTGPLGRDREHQLQRQEDVLEKVGREGEDDGFLKEILFPPAHVTKTERVSLASILGSSRVWYQLSLHPTDDAPSTLASSPTITSAWSAGTVSRQLRAWRLPEWANRRSKNLDFTADFDHTEFVQRYAPLGCLDGKDGIESWIMERGWSNGEVIVGNERIWMREHAWWEAESMLDLKPATDNIFSNAHALPTPDMLGTGYSTDAPTGSGFFHSTQNLTHQDSQEGLVTGDRKSSVTMAQSLMTHSKKLAGDYGLGTRGDDVKGQVYYTNENGEIINNLDPELADPTTVTEVPITRTRRIWVAVVWAMTFWIPSFLLRHIGRMKRPDVRMAWREKVVLVWFIFFLNAFIIFWIIFFGLLLCPNRDKAWNADEVSHHLADNDFWVSIHGKVYDISKFWQLQHSKLNNVKTSRENMQQFAGMNLDEHFLPPLTLACPGIVTDENIFFQPNVTIPEGIHTSGKQSVYHESDLAQEDWYKTHFQPRIKEYYHGDLVVKRSTVRRRGQEEQYKWFILHNKVYDLSDYYNNLDLLGNADQFRFIDDSVSKIITENPGTDITSKWNENVATSNSSQRIRLANTVNCFDNAFYVGKPDFRNSFKCQFNNYALLAFTIIICAVVVIKFLSALQFGSKRRPSPQDKFVICQVPAYTEGEDSLRKALDSLTALQYDNKRKLICVICDGMIVGSGNDRPTPKIVLDILGVDPKIDPPALPFKSVGESNEQLNYGKVYSGLYEFEGNVVPYIVVVKVGKESEQSKAKPGNRGKRDSQVVLMNFLNRVHHRAPMSPLELEMFHQINNIIGVDPELYEYLLMVDADTSVREDSLNRLVAACANNAKIAGICGETSLENEERSWWTMIQVYEYYISHHLAKAFESLFGSVTCLPGW